MSTKKPLRILRLPAVRERLGGVGSETVYRLARLGKFPKPVKLSEGGNASGWYEHEVEAYLEKLAAQRDGAAA
jgi:predicted DNA-binding transcriptional regulator AlpA